MARTQGLSSLQFSPFADSYDVYVDYGQGLPVKMNNTESTFIDVEKFLIGQSDQSNMRINKKYNENKLITKTNCTYNSAINSEQPSTHYFIRQSIFSQYGEENTNPTTNHNYCSTFTPSRSHRNASSTSSRMRPKIIHDEIWLSNKQYNSRVATFIDYLHDKFNYTDQEISDERKPLRSGTHRVTSGRSTRERIYPAINKTKLCLHIAVNGASKSMRGEIPLSNLNINNGDFGDDAGMFVDNRENCFVGLADGAGGNRSLGLNPADFSQAVLAACRNILYENNLHSHQLPRLILSAMKQVEASTIRGSSTLCLLALDKQEHTLTSLNIGDSGFVVYRNNEIYRRSTCTISGNGSSPRQLFSFNDSLGLPCFINENEIRQACSLDTVKVQKGDLIILSSDGLWDVIEANQLQRIIKRNAKNHLQDLANDLLNQAVDGYIINNRDDILIIVCRVDEL